MSNVRIGIAIQASDAADAVARIAEAERLDIDAAWLTSGGGGGAEPLTIFAAALGRTQRILLGSSIVQTWPRHPVVLAQQVVALEALGPGRIRLGIGTGHEPAIVQTFGYRWYTPLTELREYLLVLRALLREGHVEFEGTHVTARASIPTPLATPIMASALRPRSFALCGELADGAISWNCPADYLVREALPAVERGARTAGRDAPPIVVHVPVCVTERVEEAREAARRSFGSYARMPFYNAMFHAAGFPGVERGEVDGLLGTLLVHGDEEQVAQRLAALTRLGLHEVLAVPLPAGSDAPAAIRRGYAAVARAAALVR